jgi:hypothetical protein
MLGGNRMEQDERFNCHACKTNHLPPKPSSQHDAFVDTHDWPSEMETAATNFKGKKCTVPGCGKNYETLDHRIAYSNHGKTSVENLYPMCKDHNQSKGDKDYYSWLREIGK